MDIKTLGFRGAVVRAGAFDRSILAATSCHFFCKKSQYINTQSKLSVSSRHCGFHTQRMLTEWVGIHFHSIVAVVIIHMSWGGSHRYPQFDSIKLKCFLIVIQLLSARQDDYRSYTLTASLNSVARPACTSPRIVIQRKAHLYHLCREQIAVILWRSAINYPTELIISQRCWKLMYKS